MTAPRLERSGPPEAGETGLYSRYANLVALGTAPLGIALLLVEFERLWRLPVAAQWTIVGFAFASALYLAGLFALPRTRPLWLAWNAVVPGRWWRYLLPAANTLFVAAMSTLGFALVSAFLDHRGIATMTPRQSLADPVNDAFGYYTWFALDAVPLLDLPETLGRERPFRLTDPTNRALLLLYKIVVIAPLIATAAILWKGSRHGRQPVATSGDQPG